MLISMQPLRARGGSVVGRPPSFATVWRPGWQERRGAVRAPRPRPYRYNDSRYPVYLLHTKMKAMKKGKTGSVGSFQTTLALLYACITTRENRDEDTHVKGLSMKPGLRVESSSSQVWASLLKRAL